MSSLPGNFLLLYVYGFFLERGLTAEHRVIRAWPGTRIRRQIQLRTGDVRGFFVPTKFSLFGTKIVPNKLNLVGTIWHDCA